jgi:hypothetical protein
LRAPFLIGTGAAFAGCVGLLFVHSGSPVLDDRCGDHALRPAARRVQHRNAAAVYVQAPAEEIGTAAGLQRTAQYIGAIAAASLLASIYGQRASDHGLHSLAMVTGALARYPVIVTLFDRTIPRVVSTSAAAEGDAPARSFWPRAHTTNWPDHAIVRRFRVGCWGSPPDRPSAPRANTPRNKFCRFSCRR